ncbi:hypothetical protein ONZ45_g17524 [Pleurotus djamor]|nr:hypothetical protein ONZ45_g17524 [Pleurotus djamor]
MVQSSTKPKKVKKSKVKHTKTPTVQITSYFKPRATVYATDLAGNTTSVQLDEVQTDLINRVRNDGVNVFFTGAAGKLKTITSSAVIAS